MEVRLISEAKQNKPETTVIAEFEGNPFWERTGAYPVHYREEDDKAVCSKCGAKGKLPWLESEARWEAHPMRCIAS